MMTDPALGLSFNMNHFALSHTHKYLCCAFSYSMCGLLITVDCADVYLGRHTFPKDIFNLKSHIFLVK